MLASMVLFLLDCSRESRCPFCSARRECLDMMRRAISLAGSVAVKYGSLLIDTPFEPSPAVATLLIAGPTVVFSVVLAALSAKA